MRRTKEPQSSSCLYGLDVYRFVKSQGSISCQEKTMVPPAISRPATLPAGGPNIGRTSDTELPSFDKFHDSSTDVQATGCRIHRLIACQGDLIRSDGFGSLVLQATRAPFSSPCSFFTSRNNRDSVHKRTQMRSDDVVLRGTKREWESSRDYAPACTTVVTFKRALVAAG